jgi:outer membrane protein assembly factor BamB
MFRANSQRTGVYNTTGIRHFKEVKWKLQLTSFNVNFSACPTVADGVICIGDGKRNFYVIDTQTGQQRWTFNPGSRYIASPTVANGIVYICSSDGIIYAIELQTRQQRWQFKITERIGLGEY